jgi:hypothetical protein
VRTLYGGDEAALAILTKADIAPAAVGTTGWGQEIAGAALADFVGGLAPQSADAALFPSPAADRSPPDVVVGADLQAEPPPAMLRAQVALDDHRRPDRNP